MAKPNPTPPTLTIQDVNRFWGHVDHSEGQGPNGDCWEWKKKRAIRGGYGDFVVSIGYRTNRNLRASRVAFFLEYNRWPSEFVLHRCDNPPCCRPSHLFEGDNDANMEDMREKGRQPKGEVHWMKTHPQDIPKGSAKGGRSKLDEQSVLEIRHRHAQGQLQKHLAVEYGVCKQTIWLVVHRKLWTHV